MYAKGNFQTFASLSPYSGLSERSLRAPTFSGISGSYVRVVPCDLAIGREDDPARKRGRFSTPL